MFFFFFDENSGSSFDDIRHVNEDGQEYWSARELMPMFEYTEWRKFAHAIKRAKKSCKASGSAVSDHFGDAAKMIPLAKGAIREVPDYHLSRYACYLIAMNGDPRKKAIALAQTYFAIKTRQQELTENYDNLTEEQKRLDIRMQMIEHNKSLAEAAHNAGVNTRKDYATFTNYGYMGLYGGLTAQDIHKKKKLKKSQKILNHMGSTELAANLFRATQTDEKLRRDNVHDKDTANRTHHIVGKAVRQTIKELGGTMPEDLPTPEKSIRQLERAKNKQLPQ